MRTNSDLCHLQHKLIGFYNLDEKCLQHGTDWVFKYSGLRFVFKWLNSLFLLGSILMHLATTVRRHGRSKNCTGVGFCIYRPTDLFKRSERKTNIPVHFPLYTLAQDCCNKYNLFTLAQCYFGTVFFGTVLF